jgi:hypothetical protein
VFQQAAGNFGTPASASDRGSSTWRGHRETHQIDCKTPAKFSHQVFNLQGRMISPKSLKFYFIMIFFFEILTMFK